jgi:Ras-related GTP-binding protein C/D
MMNAGTVMPRVLLAGQHYSGKTSIREVVIDGKAPHDTVYLESTVAVERHETSSDFVQFEVLDLPGQTDVLQLADTQALLNDTHAIVFVMDCANGDTKTAALNRLVEMLVMVHRRNPNASVEVFLHKIDKLTEAQQKDVRHEADAYVKSRVIAEVGREWRVTVPYHMTSIYDNSVFEAFSYVVQKLVPQRSLLHSNMQLLVSNSCIASAFLFDIRTKLCIARYPREHDASSGPIYALCGDAVEMVKKVRQQYDHVGDDSESEEHGAAYDTSINSEITLHGTNTMLRLLGVSRCLMLAMVGDTTVDAVANSSALVEYNAMQFRSHIEQVLSLEPTHSTS